MNGLIYGVCLYLYLAGFFLLQILPQAFLADCLYPDEWSTSWAFKAGLVTEFTCPFAVVVFLNVTSSYLPALTTEVERALGGPGLYEGIAIYCSLVFCNLISALFFCGLANGEALGAGSFWSTHQNGISHDLRRRVGLWAVLSGAPLVTLPVLGLLKGIACLLLPILDLWDRRRRNR